MTIWGGEKALACSVMLAGGQEGTWEGPGWRWWWWRQSVGVDNGDSTALVTLFYGKWEKL